MSKYKNVAVELDGIRFDSKREALRYSELKMLLRSGIIKNLECQVPFELNALDKNMKPAKVGKYLADFVYMDQDGRTVVEDVKGVSTALFKWKARHFELQYGLRIVLT